MRCSSGFRRLHCVLDQMAVDAADGRRLSARRSMQSTLISSARRSSDLAVYERRPLGVRAFPVVLALSGVILVALLVVHIVVGTVELTPAQVLKALLNRADAELHRQVVWGLRLPRALVAIGAGALLGLAGAILQTVTRNPLADSSLLGVSSGGVLAVVVWISMVGRGAGMESLPDTGLMLPVLAFVGGLAAAGLVYLLSWQGGATDTTRLILTGVLVGGMCSAFTSVLLLWADESSVQRILRWTIGSTAGRVWDHWHTLWPAAVLALPFGLACAGLANVLQLGDDVAAGLGVRVERARLALLLASALLAAGAVAVVGNVGFIGLIGPHMARRIVGQDVRRLFPFSAVLAAILLVASDIVARTLTLDGLGRLLGLALPPGAGMPVGAVTALLGAPFFLLLLLRRSR
jgi:iron complex transport system permease protein